MIFLSLVATVLTVYGIETQLHLQHRFYSICCNSAYRLRYWNALYEQHSLHIWFVATVLTVYGIETSISVVPMAVVYSCNSAYRLRYWNGTSTSEVPTLFSGVVATVLTVYGIETEEMGVVKHQTYRVATVLTVYGIETHIVYPLLYPSILGVATVLTVYGIETL